MFSIALSIALILAGLIVLQAFLAAGFIRRLKAPVPEPLPDTRYPKTALIICIRGKDSTLQECLDAALNQDYPDYGVHVVVDNKSDPAWPVVKKLVAANPQTRATVQTLRKPLMSCSLKCSSLIQAVSGLDATYEVIALLDTDVAPRRRWLKDMVSPLADPSVGATTGNRWFAPQPATLPSLARYAWNAAAVVLMYRLEIAWGGSLAIKRAVMDDGRLLTHWSRTYGDDTAINPALRRLGLRLETVPSALITERSACGMRQFLDWATRQLLSCRLHHHYWKAVLAHGIATSVSLGSAAVVFLAGVVTSAGTAALLAGASLAGYVLLLLALLLGLESGVRRVSLGRDRPEGEKQPASSTLTLVFAIMLAQVLYPYVLIRAATARTVVWRDARYRILGHSRIRRVGDHAAPHGAHSALANPLGASPRQR